ncbi:MAG TPA: dipeptidase [Spirochaetia bacterium]|nr:dipeptidase [Spirochaetia bacterium]
MNAMDLHRDALVWDAHRDVAYEAPLSERFLQRWMIGVDLHLPRLARGGINVQTFALCIGPEIGRDYVAQALRELDQVFTILDAHRDDVVLVTRTADALQAKRQGKIAVFLSFEGAEPILTELGLLRMFHRMGLRAMGLTWNYRNETADGGYEGREGYGLSQFGAAVVKEMNRLGMVIDIAHATPQTMRDVLRASEQPVIHSHGGVRAVNPEHPRTLDDAVLEQIARNGGVFCATTVPQAISTPAEEATLERYLDVIDHAVKVMGADHVGLGADFDVYQSHLPYAIGHWLPGLEEADQWPEVTAGLLRRGHSEVTVRKILGENLQRVYQQVVG